jgi:hypothetical protein
MYYAGQRHVSGTRMAIAVLTLGCLLSFGVGQVLGHHRAVAAGRVIRAGSSLHQGGSASGSLTFTPTPAALPNAAPASIPLAAPVNHSAASGGEHANKTGHHDRPDSAAHTPKGDKPAGKSDGGNGEGDGSGGGD